ncbi:MAG: SDR family NAD(P)-dependent oxidoreductase [Bacteroidetes bacterium]|nr:SDR family NAD(P)-dependent oxidoreductase [Bacteroidota bacterium]
MILVTGGTGFLGAYIIKALIEKGYPVRAIRRSANLPAFISSEILNKAEWVEGDVLDVVSLQNAMQGVNAVIHSAAVVSFLRKERKNMFRVNVDGTANVVNMALENNVKRLIHISSVAALGRTAHGGHVNEEKKWEESKVNTHYGKSKYKAELEVWRGMGEGLDAVILNPSTVLGYGDWNSGSCAIFRNIYREFKWYTTGINGFVDVEDVVKVVLFMMESSITEERFIVNGATWSFKKLQETIADHFHKKRPFREANSFLLGLAWRMEKLQFLLNGKKPLLTKESARVAVSKTWFENDKLLSVLPGFSFTPLEETIQKACKKYLETTR